MRSLRPFSAISASNQTLRVEVSNIRYSQETIDPVFSKGPPTSYQEYGVAGEGLPLQHVLEMLRSGQISPQSFPRIRVVRVHLRGSKAYKQGKGASQSVYFSLDNRRLWLFKAANIKTIMVDVVNSVGVELQRKLTSRDYGHSVKFRAEAIDSNIPSLDGTLVQLSVAEIMDDQHFVNKVRRQT